MAELTNRPRPLSFPRMRQRDAESPLLWLRLAVGSIAIHFVLFFITLPLIARFSTAQQGVESTPIDLVELPPETATSSAPATTQPATDTEPTTESAESAQPEVTEVPPSTEQPEANSPPPAPVPVFPPIRDNRNTPESPTPQPQASVPPQPTPPQPTPPQPTPPQPTPPQPTPSPTPDEVEPSPEPSPTPDSGSPEPTPVPPSQPEPAPPTSGPSQPGTGETETDSGSVTPPGNEPQPPSPSLPDLPPVPEIGSRPPATAPVDEQELPDVGTEAEPVPASLTATLRVSSLPASANPTDIPDELAVPRRESEPISAGAIGSACPAIEPEILQYLGQPIELRIAVDDQGQVIYTEVSQSSQSEAYDQLGACLVEQWEFEPAITEGQPVFSNLVVLLSIDEDR